MNLQRVKAQKNKVHINYNIKKLSRAESITVMQQECNQAWLKQEQKHWDGISTVLSVPVWWRGLIIIIMAFGNWLAYIRT